MKRVGRIIAFAPFALALLMPPASAASCVNSAYAIAELGGIGGPVTQALAIAEDGTIAGWGLDAAWVSHALRWSSGEVTTLSNATSAASGISSAGGVAGWQSGRRGTQATIWSPAVTTLRTPRGSIGAQAADVNQTGLAAGWAFNSIGDTSAISWNGTRPTSLVSGPGAPSISLAVAVNDAGTIVGRGDFASEPFRRALSWMGRAMTVLPTLGDGVDSATAISQSGLITGAGLSPADSKFHAVVWNGNAVTDLGLFGAHPTSGWGVNSCGTVVGDAVVDVADEVTEAVIWQGGSGAVALESLLPPTHGWDLHTARAISDAGAIVGYGFRTGQSGLRAFVLTPA